MVVYENAMIAAAAETTQVADFVAKRQFAPMYIWLDIAFLLVFAGLLLWRRKTMTVLVGLAAGVLYFAVDYGIFNLALHTRSIEGGSMFWVLLWMSMSYGFTNFAWIWLWISKDSHLFEWSLLILGWWFCAPPIVQTLVARFAPDQADHPIIIQRTTGAYHGWMALILFVGYLALIIWNLAHERRSQRVNIPWLLAIGVLVQFGWELGLLIGGIRSAGLGLQETLKPLVVNSLLETNLGMPYVYVIFLAVTARYTETLSKRTHPITMLERLAENNAECVTH
ncbi:hypothetical protein BEUL_0515 [Bifidobacterium eulemuris]|nr:hypothetical protein BEUL_0515 [Bifidobacterium eulemuris]